MKQPLPDEKRITRVARELERAFLGKCVSRKRSSVGGLRDFDANRGSIRSGQQSRAQYGELRKYFAVEFGNEVILAVFVVAPDLSELDGFHCHWIGLNFVDSIPDYRDALRASIALLSPWVTKGRRCETTSRSPHIRWHSANIYGSILGRQNGTWR